MGDNVREFSETYQKKREVGTELDQLLDKRRGYAVMARKVADGWISDQERDAVLKEYTRLVSECDSQLGRLRWQLEVLDAELDSLAEVHGPQRTWRNA